MERQWAEWEPVDEVCSTELGEGGLVGGGVPFETLVHPTFSYAGGGRRWQ